MCGIVGVTGQEDAAKAVFLGLYALQHRGEEAAGIASYDDRTIHIVKNPGLVVDALQEQDLEGLAGRTAVGHCRYSTTGTNSIKNIQPFLVVHKDVPIAVAHNGNLTNTADLYHELEAQGSLFQTTMDSEIIVHLLAKHWDADPRRWLGGVLARLEGAFSLVFLIGDAVVGARDPHGFRPLCLGRLRGKYVLASESCALDIMGAEFIREIEPGEVVILRGERMESFRIPGPPVRRAQCIFEDIYFARPDSDIFDANVYRVRKRLGAQLAREHPVDADFVMPIPDSGMYAALGYAQELGLPFEVGMIRNHYVGRTFIQPTQFVRDFRVRVKLNPIRDVIQGRRVVVIEDSIVRGTTSRSRIEEIRRAGAREIHMRITCPPIRFPCFFGIDFPSPEELIAHRKTVEEIARFIRVDSLAYLSLEGLLASVDHPGAFCHACFSGDYPVEVPKTRGKHQLENGCTIRHGGHQRAGGL